MELGKLAVKHLGIRTSADADQRVVTDVFTTAVATAELILKNGEQSRERPAIQLARTIAIAAAAYPYPEPLEKADEGFDRPIWGPTPKIEAAQAVVNYVSNWDWIRK